ncbi:MAG: AbrB/MazE/SpoVT family DNA-binding domain-containing protein [Ruminococcaceae bacterium]|nr:AbrB/MazE/SpoVT family DNA-binding domain-containing protein [Oscillospiraceae bacterium]
MTIIGIPRHIDNLGRITLPSEIRKMYQLAKDDTVEIVGTPDGILLRIPNITVVRLCDEGEIERVVCEEIDPAVDAVEALLK